MIATAEFTPTRAAGLARLDAFVPFAGRAYAEGRNSDPGPDAPGSVSRLSPYVRHRLVTESEVVAAVLARHSAAAAEKFVQEVLWRTYWKGWLEMRPAVWRRYCAERDAERARVPAGVLASAEAGNTGIEGFDDWARELVATGYLHNHARMWFASIWIFTLRLPWALGADFFMRHLIDGDPASNTLSWRWVAGLQTAGKTYLATADNIARYTGGRFHPRGLAASALPLGEAPVPAPVPPADLPVPDVADPTLLLLTPEDLRPETLFRPDAAIRTVHVLAQSGGGAPAQAFVAGAAADAAARASAHFGCPAIIVDGIDAASLASAAEAAGAVQIVTPYAPVGPIADALAGLPVQQVRRRWDSLFWPHARKGFFAFKAEIPRLLGALPVS